MEEGRNPPRRWSGRGGALPDWQMVVIPVGIIIIAIILIQEVVVVVVEVVVEGIVIRTWVEAGLNLGYEI